MSNLEKAFLGALGGLSAVLVKFLGQDYHTVVAQAANLTEDQLLAYKLGYGILTPILMFLGGFVGWISDEQQRMKLVALAIAAPAMITTWAGGIKDDKSHVAFLDIVASAYAEAWEPTMEAGKVKIPDTVKDASTWDRVQRGVRVFFGYGNREPQRFWVIVGSYKEREAAQQFADKINVTDKTLSAWVGVKVSPNDYYPVIVGTYSYLSEAKELRRKALSSSLIKDAYLSSGAQR
jgi:hypothetical protein